MKKLLKSLLIAIISLSIGHSVFAQTNQDSSWKHVRKNIIRYNLSGPIFFGIDKYILVGYERLLSPRQSMSINTGAVGLPRFVAITTDSFDLRKDIKNSGFNISLDYRFYLQKENKFIAPRGVYLGPYYAYNKFNRDNAWLSKHTGGANDEVTTSTKFQIHTFGAELGYQFIFWKRLALDLVLVGPGLSSYYLKTKIDGNLSGERQQLLYDAVKQLIEQKFPGMDIVFDGEEFNSSGLISKWDWGYRYMIHIGFNF